jgi:quinol monooxygenase YgiN
MHGRRAEPRPIGTTEELEMACQVFLEFRIKDGCEEQLKDYFKEILPDTREYDGCIQLYMVRDHDDPQKIVVVEFWDTRRHYEKYLAWRQETGVMDKLATMLDSPSWRFFDFWGV